MVPRRLGHRTTIESAAIATPVADRSAVKLKRIATDLRQRISRCLLPAASRPGRCH